MLLTALHLGPGARILSNDVMRQHHSALSSLTEDGCVLIHATCYEFGQLCILYSMPQGGADGRVHAVAVRRAVHASYIEVGAKVDNGERRELHHSPY